MRVILQEYGRTILTLCAGSIAILLCATFLTKQLGIRIGSKWADELVIEETTQCPVIETPRVIKIDLNDNEFNRYRDLATAYETEDRLELCQNLEVEGSELVDVRRPGHYHVRYIAKNKLGNICEKQVGVIVR